MIRGKCHCGRIEFELRPPTKMCSHCHCESCRRTHGAAFVTWTSVDENDFMLRKGEDHLAHYESSPGIDWQFCRHCGSPMFQTTRHSPGIVYVVVAALVDPLDRAPDAHVSFEEKVPWLTVGDTLPKYREKTSDLLR